MADASVVNVKKLKVAELKKELALRGLKVTGNKAELQLRLEEYFKLQGLIVAEGDTVEDEDDDEEDSSLEEDEDSSNGNQQEESPEDDNLPETSLQAVVKTDVPKPLVSEVQEEAEAETKAAVQPNGEAAAKLMSPLNRKIKIAAAPKIVSDVDKKLKRMQRFGETTTTATTTPQKDKKTERAKRFGNNSVITSANVKASLPSADVEKLKKRAERFGAVSPAIVQLEDSEKLKKRKERFGMISTDVDARKKLRAERFNL